MQEAKAVFDLIRAMKRASNIKVNRHFEGFVADRIVHAVTEPTILAAMERLAKGLRYAEHSPNTKTGAVVFMAFTDLCTTGTNYS